MLDNWFLHFSEHDESGTPSYYGVPHDLTKMVKIVEANYVLPLIEEERSTIVKKSISSVPVVHFLCSHARYDVLSPLSSLQGQQR